MKDQPNNTSNAGPSAPTPHRHVSFPHLPDTVGAQPAAPAGREAPPPANKPTADMGLAAGLQPANPRPHHLSPTIAAASVAAPLSAHGAGSARNVACSQGKGGQGVGGEVPLPTYLQVEPVGQCNLRCQMCSIQFRRDGPPFGPLAFMELANFTRLIDGFPTLTELHLQGLGEPMMHPRFFEMVAYAARKGIRVSTNSNATLLNDRRAESCVTSGLDCLHVSIDGATATTYERIRARAHFDRVTGNVERLLATRARLGSATPRLRMVAVIMRQNLHELPDLVRLAARWNVEGFFVQHLCHDFGESSLPAYYAPMRRFVDEQTLLTEDPARVSRYFGEARTVARALGVDLRLPRTQPRLHSPGTPGRDRCDWPWRGAYVSYSGEAMPCCMVSTPDRISLGNVAGAGVDTVWNGDAYQRFRAALSSDEPPEVCRSCAIYTGTF